LTKRTQFIRGSAAAPPDTRIGAGVLHGYAISELNSSILNQMAKHHWLGVVRCRPAYDRNRQSFCSEKRCDH